MNLRQIEYFVHVAESGSFSRASAVMGLTQPAISRQVSALERELSLRLMHRNGRGILLTDAGHRFLIYARGILHQLDGARHAVTGNEADLAGKVVVGLPPSLGQVLTMPLVRAFRERYQSADLAIVEALSVPLQERILAGRVDVAIIHNPAPSSLVRIEPMFTETLCLLSAAMGAQSRPMPFRALEQFDLIFPSAPHPIRSLVEAGYGHAVVPYNVVRAGMSGAGIVARPIVRPALGSTVALVTPTRRPSTLLAEGVADILRRMLRETLQRKKS
jgi:LysR family nitrogen assimilation transcriptional regulator